MEEHVAKTPGQLLPQPLPYPLRPDRIGRRVEHLPGEHRDRLARTDQALGKALSGIGVEHDGEQPLERSVVPENNHASDSIIREMQTLAGCRRARRGTEP